MTKKIVGIILILIIGSGIYVVMNAKDSSGRKDAAMPDAGQTPAVAAPQSTTATPAAPQAGKYVDYTNTVLASTAGTKILFFYAPWCPQCRTLENSIKAQGVPEGVTIIKVDYDTNQALRRQYGVTIQTTLVRVDDAGQLQKKFVAYDNPTLDSLKQNLL